MRVDRQLSATPVNALASGPGEPSLSPEQKALVRLWEEHMAYEFTEKDARRTIATTLSTS